MLKSIYRFFHAHYHRRYHGIYRHAKELFIFDLILLGSAIVLFAATAFLFFWKPGIGRQIEIDISLGNDRIRSGEDVTVSVRYVNYSKVTLEKPVLALRLPGGFIHDTNRAEEPKLGSNNTLALESVAPGAEGTITLHGTLWTEPQAEDRITATLSFERSDTHTTEQSMAAYLVSLPESVLRSTINVRTSTFPGQPIPFTYNFANTSNRPLTGINITVPAGVTFDSTVDTNNLSFKPQETKTFSGKLTVPNKTGITHLTFTPRFTLNGRQFTQSTARDTQSINVFYPSTISTISWKTTPRYIEPGATAAATVSWKNTSAFALTKQRVRIEFNPRIVDLQKTARENNLKIDGATLIADATNRTALADGRPDSDGSFDITLHFLTNFGAVDTNQFRAHTIFEAQINEVPGVYFSNPGSSQSTAPLATNLTLTEQVRYYTNEGDQLGRGPLPPVVGETTKYWVMVEVTNSSNDVRDARFSAVLAPGVTFTDNQSVTIGPELSYNASNRTVSWGYKKLPAHSTTGLYFEVSVTPSADAIGTVLPLISSSRLTATDDVVGKEFTLSKGVLTNTLPTSDKGAVLGAKVTTP